MKRYSLNEMVRNVRYWLHPQTKLMDERTEQIDQNIASIRKQKELNRQMISSVNQPDVLRSLVISMSKTDG